MVAEMILVTGATGSNGRELINVLTLTGVAVRAMVRSMEHAQGLIGRDGVDVVVGDFDRAETLRAVLKGIDRAFLVTNSSERAEQQQLAFVEAGRAEGLRHIVKLTQLAADENSPVRFLRYHGVVERSIRESGMEYTFLRPNLYMQGLLGFAQTISAAGTFSAAAGDSVVSMVDVRDNAAAAAAALTTAGHEGKTYDLTGPQGLTHVEMANIMSSILGRRIVFVDQSPDEMQAAMLKMGMPRWQAEGLVEDYAHYRRGEASAVSTGVIEATGVRPRSFEEFVHDYRNVLLNL